MPPDKVYKTVCQFNSIPVSAEDMEKLQEIADDYCKVKNYVYQRYGGIKSLDKIYPGYTVQNEMTASGLRGQLGLPSVYFYLAIFDALGDIKTQWSQIKNKILNNIKNNPNLTLDEGHYLRFVMKVSGCFAGILLRQELKMSDEFQEKFNELSSNVEMERVNKYLCRQVRKYLIKMHTDKAEGFALTERAYRYGNHGIYISVKEKRKRIFILLTDNNQYKNQLYISLYPKKNNVILRVPIEVKVKHHSDYNRTLGLAIGFKNMFVTDKGHVYGENYGEYQLELIDHIKQGTSTYRRNQKYNTGRMKYENKKKRLEARLHTYVNAEINQLLSIEKPEVIYIPKLPQSSLAGKNKSINHSINMWQRGYVRKRLTQKCKEQSIQFVEVFGKDISNECSQCGSIGSKKSGMFFCEACHSQRAERINTAQNVLVRGTHSI